MTTLYHPNIGGMAVEVPDSDVEAWTEQGWRKTDPAAKTAKTAASGDNK